MFRKLLPLAVILLFISYSFPVEAWEPSDALSALQDALPDAVRQEVIDDGDIRDDLYRGEFWVHYLQDTAGNLVSPMMSLFISVTGILLLLTVGNLLTQDKCVKRLIAAVAVPCLYRLTEDIFTDSFRYLTDIGVFAEALIPIFGTLYAAGGNTATAVSTGGTFTLFLYLSEWLVNAVLSPLIRLIIALSLLSQSTDGILDISGITSAVQKTYTTVILFLTTILAVILPTQSLLTQSADSVAGKSVKFIIGNAVPVIGNGLSSTLSTVSASIAYLRSVTGGLAVFAIIFIILPPLVRLLLTRFVFSLCEGIAKMMGTKEGEKMIHTFLTVFDMLTATLFFSSVAIILLSAVFAKCMPAL